MTAHQAEHRRICSTQAAFTLIELLVALSIIALLLTLVSPRYFTSVTKAEETLKNNLAVLRDAIDKHYADNEKYPDKLEDLVQKKYIRAVPLDPVTHSESTWIVMAPDDTKKGAIFDVKSGATGTARDGSEYAKW
jgi:general secretion pathway protein G